jgi:uncharacterized phage-associated protein
MFENRRDANLPLQPDTSHAYPGPMPVSAHDVAAELRKRIPGLGVKKLHKLLYYSQGHHLATFGRPLFVETISAYDMGPVVGVLWRAEKDGDPPPPGQARMGEAELNTIGYVASRYGALSATDLEHLTHSETPWQRANATRRPGGRVRIENQWIEEYFRTAGAADAGEDEIVLDSDEVAKMLAGAELRRHEPRTPDDLEKLRAMIAGRG